MTRTSIRGVAGVLAIIIVVVVVVVMSHNKEDSDRQGASREFFGTRTYDTSDGQEMRPDWNK